MPKSNVYFVYDQINVVSYMFARIPLAEQLKILILYTEYKNLPLSSVKWPCTLMLFWSYSVQFSVDFVPNLPINATKELLKILLSVCAHKDYIIMQIFSIHQFGLELLIRFCLLIHTRLIMTVKGITMAVNCEQNTE